MIYPRRLSLIAMHSVFNNLAKMCALYSKTSPCARLMRLDRYRIFAHLGLGNTYARHKATRKGPLSWKCKKQPKPPTAMVLMRAELLVCTPPFERARKPSAAVYGKNQSPTIRWRATAFSASSSIILKPLQTSRAFFC